VNLIEFGRLLLTGLATTLALSLAAGVVAFFVAFALGLARLSEKRFLRWPATVIVELSRGTSLFVQIFWFFYALPFAGIQLNAFFVGVVAIGLNGGAFGSEVVRGAILSVPKEQIEGGIALNLTRRQRFVHVTLPQALVLMLPGFSSSAIDLIKATSLVSLITISDLTFYASLYKSETGNTFIAFGALLLIYYIVCSAVSWAFSGLERRYTVGMDVTRHGNR
jgi:polar amino acid transport system permease protein